MNFVDLIPYLTYAENQQPTIDTRRPGTDYTPPTNQQPNIDG